MNGEGLNQQDIDFAANDGDTTFIGTYEPELLVNLMMDMDMSVPDIHACPYYPNVLENVYAIKTEDLPNGPDRVEEITLRIERLQNYGPIGYAEQSLFGHRTGTVGDLINKLVPTHREEGRSYNDLIFWCEGTWYLEKVVNILFSLSTEKINVAQLKVGDSDVHLIHAENIKSPIVLAKFANMDEVTIFYSPLATSYIWMEWGWRYEFARPSFYNIFQPDSDDSIFIFKDKSPEKIKSSRIQFKPLTKFMKLHFDIGTRIQTADPRTFNYVIERNLRLKNSSLAARVKEEMEELLQQQHEIQEKIEWLSNMESIFATQISQKIMFYPFGIDRRDPVFPRFFFRNHSLYQLRQLKFYYGHMQSFGDGVMVAGKHFIDSPKSGGFNISRKFYPRNGMVFESCREWAYLTGFRVMLPSGFDLFPYLELDEEDNKIIVRAFLEIIGHDIPEDKKKDIEANPLKYIYFIFPGQDKTIADWEKADLEGIVLHENEFRPFDMKIVNMGIHFAMNDEESNIANKSFTDSVVQNISAQFDKSVHTLSEHLEAAFQKERLILKKRAEAFMLFVEKKEQEFADSEEKTRNAVKEIKNAEKIITGYEKFLGELIGEYPPLIQESSRDFQEFIGEIHQFVNVVNRDIDSILEDNKEEFRKKLEFLKGLKDSISQLVENIKSLKVKRDDTQNALEQLKQFDKEFSDEFNSAGWNLLKMTENIQSIWSMQDVFKGMQKHIKQLEDNIEKSIVTAKRGSVYSTSVSVSTTHAKKWFDSVFSELSRLSSKLLDTSISSDSKLSQLLNNAEKPVSKCMMNLEQSVDQMIQMNSTSEQKKEFYKAIENHVAELKDGVNRLSSLLYKEKAK